MELKYLKTFKTILDLGTFQKAAENLNYSQSTITFQIQQLEQELAVKLFEKIGRRMVLTQAGQEILPYVNTILHSIDQLENYSKHGNEIKGTLKIAMPESLLTYRMQAILKKFQQQAPSVKLSIQVLNCYVIREQILNGNADIGIHYDTGGYGSSVIKKHLADFPLALVASSELAPNLADFLSAHQKKPVYLITNDPNSIFQNMFDAYLKKQDIILDNVLELGSIEAIKRSVISNLGIAFLPKYVVQEELNLGKVQALSTGLDKKTISSVCTYHKNKWLSPAMELFIQILLEHKEILS